LRAAFQGNRWIHGVAGAFLSRKWNEFGYPPFLVPGLAATGLWPTDLAWSADYPAVSSDKALYGEAYLSHASFELTLGLRKYWVQEASTWVQNGLLNGGLSESLNLRSGDAGTNPKAAISYKLGEEALVYASVSKGFRAGFPNPVLPKVCDPGLAELGVTRQSLADVYPDTVWNYEIGAKREVGGLVLTGALYQMNWQNIQQRVTIPICDNNIVANAGAARNRGAEFELTGEVSTAMNLRLAAGFDDAVITRPGLSGQPVGSPVYNAPRITLSAAATYRWRLNARLEGFIEVDDSYISNSLSGTTLSGTHALTRAGYDVLNARAALRWGSNEITLYGKNLTDRRANLGDINPISYVQRDANGEPLPRVAVTAPLQLGIQMRHGF
jgi:outer membrane receptor protein involved in Fe transport